jgi:pimeloyl-ACP methyl ester carboxylesterase
MMKQVNSIGNNARIHRAVSADGTEIAGRVHGQGAPLVLVTGGPGDGETSWRSLEPFLSEQFTCYCMSTRGKGLSADHSDHSVGRRVQDITAFVDSIGEPVGMIGHSEGGVLALEAAAQVDAVSSLALYEPANFEGLSQEQAARFQDSVARIERAVEEGRLVDAAQIFFENLALANEEELSILSSEGVFERMAPNMPTLHQDVTQSGPPRLSDASLPEQITMPVLLLRGSQTHPLYVNAVRNLSEQLADSQVRVISGAGHLAPQIMPEPVADELIRFFQGSLELA